MKNRVRIALVLIGFSVLSTVLIVFAWTSVGFERESNTEPNLPSSDSEWVYYIEPCIYTASEEVIVDGITYSLETYMWRDFMPISPPDGKPLIVIIRIHAEGVDDFPLSTIIKRLWLIDDSDLTSTLPTEEYSVNGNTLEMVFRNGPKWGPGILVDVVVKLAKLDLNFCIKAIDQTIHRTD